MSSDQGSSKGKATADPANNVGFRPQVNMTVLPPKREDLQKSYASIVDDNANPKGWYGSMSMCPPLSWPQSEIILTDVTSQRHRRSHRHDGRVPVLYLLPKPLQAS